MDLLFCSGLMVEAKTVAELLKSHKAQTLHYLLLAGMQDGLLINLRPERVEKEFVSTTLNLHQRRQINIDDCEWIATNRASERWKRLFMEDQFNLFLSHTRLSHLQWVNMNNHEIEFRTITR